MRKNITKHLCFSNMSSLHVAEDKLVYIDIPAVNLGHGILNAK